MYPEKLEVDRTRWFGNDFLENSEFVMAFLHKDYDTKMHSHEFYEINIVVNGEGRHYIGNINLPVSVGDVFVIPPNIEHGYLAEESIDIYHLLIKNDFLNRYREELAELPGYNVLFDFEPLIRRISGLDINLKLTPKNLDEIKSDLQKIESAAKRRLYMYENILAINFIEKLGNLFEKSMIDINFTTKENIEIIGVLEYIKNHLSEKISVGTIAKHANMSSATLNRRFKEILNVTPMEYVRLCRINMARKLIKEGNFTKAEIAQTCGFYDQVHMHKTLALQNEGKILKNLALLEDI